MILVLPRNIVWIKKSLSEARSPVSHSVDSRSMAPAAPSLLDDFHSLHKTPWHHSRRWSDLKCPPPLPSLLSGPTRESPLPSYLQHQQVLGKSTNGLMVYFFSFHNSERIWVKLNKEVIRYIHVQAGIPLFWALFTTAAMLWPTTTTSWRGSRARRAKTRRRRRRVTRGLIKVSICCIRK